MSDIPLQEWLDAHQPDDNLIYKKGFWNQAVFVRDELTHLVASGLSYPQRQKMGVCWAISSHVSKSVTLPVYLLYRPDLDLRLVMRGNFYNWKLSVASEKPIEADFTGLFYTTPPVEPEYTGDELHPVYFEGFPPDLIFGYYENSDRRRWSAQLGSDRELWTTVYLIMRALGAIKACRRHTQESHREELAREREG